MSIYGGMKTLVALLVLMLVFCVDTHAQTATNMTWQQKTVKVDGSSAEWEFPLRLYDPKTKLNYNFSNDSRRMYFVFVANENIARYKILKSGFSIEIDTMGGKKYNTKFLFEPNSLTYRPNPANYSARMDSAGRRPNWSMPVKITGKGLKNVPDGEIDIKNGIEISLVSTDEFGRMFCEISIPFSLYYKDSLKKVGDENVFSVRLSINKIETKGTNTLMDSGGTGGSVTGTGSYGNGGSYNGGRGAGGGMGGYPGGGMGNGYPNSGGMGNGDPTGGYPSGGDMQDNNAPAPNAIANNPEYTTKNTFILKLKPSTTAPQ